MLERFGEPYRDYQERVSMFLPRPGEWQRLVSALRDPVFPT